MSSRLFYLIPAVALIIGVGYVAMPGATPIPDAAADAEPVARSGGHPVVVELFTSQGCSSCPPADALLARLAKDPGVIAISRPVTYWDRLGWRDTLALPANTVLQQGYAARHIPGAGVYTPQAVVQGAAGTVGSRTASLTGLIAQHSSLPEISITITGGPAPSLTLDGKPGAPATVQLLGLDSAETVRIGSGENGGRTVSYVNILKNEAKIADWRGGPTTIAIDRRLVRAAGVDRHAIIVRSGDAGPILAARYL
ncbi:DUF1223 domain-containing protein [Sphingomonas sp. CJ99]